MARARLLVLTQGRLDRLDDLVVAAGAERGRVLRLDDALELFTADAEEDGLAVLDLDATPIEDAGLLRRWREARPAARLLWVGDDGARVEAFAAAGAPGEFLPWPLDLLDLSTLAHAAGGSGPGQRPPLAPTADPSTSAPREGAAPRNGPATNGGPAGGSGPTRTNGTGDLGAIEAILGTAHEGRAADEGIGGAVVGGVPRGAGNPAPRARRPRAAFLRFEAAPRPEPARPSVDPPVPHEDFLAPEEQSTDGLELDLDGPLLTEEELEAFFDPAPLPQVAATETESAPENGVETDAEQEPDPAAPAEAAALDVARRRPAWLKDQTADLADIVMTLDLQARASHAHVGLEGELARLRQFTRTIGYVAAPPAPGDQDVDVAVLVEEQLGGLAGTSPDAPRLLFRVAPEAGTTTVRADKALVSMALDALLRAAIGCAGAGDVVRVSVDGADGGPAVRIEFPRGPLADLRPEDVLEPYALKTRLPEIGSNALAAAGGIAVGQGGDLLVSEASAETLAFEVSFGPAPAP